MKPYDAAKKLYMAVVKRTAYETPAIQDAKTTLSLKKGGEEAQKAQDLIAAQKADLLVVAAYGLILPQSVLDMPAGIGPDHAIKAVNLHASLLPRWRGAAPVTRHLLPGYKWTSILSG